MPKLTGIIEAIKSRLRKPKGSDAPDSQETPSPAKAAAPRKTTAFFPVPDMMDEMDRSARITASDN